MRVMGDRGAFVKQHGDVQEAALRDGARPDRAGWGEEPAERWGIFSDGVRIRACQACPALIRISMPVCARVTRRRAAAGGRRRYCHGP